MLCVPIHTAWCWYSKTDWLIYTQLYLYPLLTSHPSHLTVDMALHTGTKQTGWGGVPGDYIVHSNISNIGNCDNIGINACYTTQRNKILWNIKIMKMISILNQAGWSLVRYPGDVIEHSLVLRVTGGRQQQTGNVLCYPVAFSFGVSWIVLVSRVSYWGSTWHHLKPGIIPPSFIVLSPPGMIVRTAGTLGVVIGGNIMAQ